MTASEEQGIASFLMGKSEHTLSLFGHFIAEFEAVGPITVSAAKTMIGISNEHHCIAWVTRLGRDFIHVFFPFKEPYEDNLCFQKIAQVPGVNQFNHHFRMLHKEDVNDELRKFMRLALDS